MKNHEHKDHEHKDQTEEMKDKKESPAEKAEEKAAEKTEKTPEDLLKEELKKAQEEIERQKDKYLRLMAEFDNFKKRTQAEVCSIISSANEDMILQVLEVVDSFERALAAEEKAPDLASYKKGVQLIYDKLTSVLKSCGAEAFSAAGEQFNPEIHDAMLQMESDCVDENCVIQEIQKGYKLKDKVIRHSRVVVSKGKASKEENKDSTDEGAEKNGNGK